jgi:hypothetical protein
MQVLQKLSWYKNRLSLMSSGEVFYRVNKVCKGYYYKIKRETYSQQKKMLPKMQTYLFEIGDLDLITNFYNENPEYQKSLIHAADQILLHRFSFFSFENYYLGTKLNWHKDYANQKTAKLSFYTDLDYRDFRKHGDAKFVWEINRFTHFFTLAQAYFLSNNTHYAEEIVLQLTDWIDQNPYLMGINWTSAL